MQEDCEPHDDEEEEDLPAGWPGVSDMVGGHDGAEPESEPEEVQPWPENAGTFEGNLPEGYVPPEKEEPEDEAPWPEDAGLAPFEDPVPPPAMSVDEFFNVEEPLEDDEADEDNMPWPVDAGRVPYADSGSEEEEADGEEGPSD